MVESFAHRSSSMSILSANPLSLLALLPATDCQAGQVGQWDKSMRGAAVAAELNAGIALAALLLAPASVIAVRTSPELQEQIRLVHQSKPWNGLELALPDHLLLMLLITNEALVAVGSKPGPVSYRRPRAQAEQRRN